MDYETIKRPNLKERIDEPEIQASIQMDEIDHYSKLYKKDNTAENEEARNYTEWCGHMAENQLSILVDEGRVLHKKMDPYPVWLRKKKYEEKIDAIIPLDRELPSDVLDIIRGYCKPVFIHFREYNQALGLFNLSVFYKQKLRHRIVDPAVREQLKICIDAHDDYQKTRAVYLHDKTPLNETLSDKSHYWTDVCKDKFSSLLDQSLLDQTCQHGYAAWYFHNEMEDAWMDESEEENDLP
uniref:Uncharacterized protein n=1 Tax=viral metagenome TaxID=1070528 RepID=A0A6C0AII1_9ZZZZ